MGGRYSGLANRRYFMHQSQIASAQFGSAAADYLTSAVHARGAER